jgi:hypothetical protein
MYVLRTEYSVGTDVYGPADLGTGNFDSGTSSRRLMRCWFLWRQGRQKRPLSCELSAINTTRCDADGLKAADLLHVN